MAKTRILCTADLHLGRSSALMSPAYGVDASALGAWKRMVDQAISYSADAIVIAGDLFEGASGYLETRRAFYESLKLLELAAIPVIAVAGNHDWQVTPLLDKGGYPNFHLIGTRGAWERRVLELRTGTVEFLGWSFTSEFETESQVATLESFDSIHPVIGVVHGDLAPQSKYHPLSASDLNAKAEAWILGHIHKPTDVAPRAVYPGSPQALDFGPGEQGVHGFRWLEVENGLARFGPMVPVSSVRYENVQITIDAAGETDALGAAISEARKICLNLAENRQFESVQMRAEVTFSGLDRLPKLDDLAFHPIEEAHGVLFKKFKIQNTIDPRSQKDLQSQSGEAARLLLGLRDRIAPDVEMAWADSAQKLLGQVADDIDFQYRRVLGGLSDRGESAIEAPSWEEKETLAEKWLVEELAAFLEAERA